jgi:hypothetical protein
MVGAVTFTCNRLQAIYFDERILPADRDDRRSGASGTARCLPSCVCWIT